MTTATPLVPVAVMFIGIAIILALVAIYWNRPR